VIDAEVRVELRSSKERQLDLAAMLREAAQEVPLQSHGGHPTAAGAILKRSDLDRLLTLVGARVERADKD